MVERRRAATDFRPFIYLFTLRGARIHSTAINYYLLRFQPPAVTEYYCKTEYFAIHRSESVRKYI